MLVLYIESGGSEIIKSKKALSRSDAILNEMFAVLRESIMCTMCTVLESAVFDDRTRVFIILLVFESAFTECCSRTPDDYSHIPMRMHITLKTATLHYITDANS